MKDAFLMGRRIPARTGRTPDYLVRVTNVGVTVGLAPTAVRDGT